MAPAALVEDLNWIPCYRLWTPAQDHHGHLGREAADGSSLCLSLCPSLSERERMNERNWICFSCCWPLSCLLMKTSHVFSTGQFSRAQQGWVLMVVGVAGISLTSILQSLLGNLVDIGHKWPCPYCWSQEQVSSFLLRLFWKHWCAEGSQSCPGQLQDMKMVLFCNPGRLPNWPFCLDDKCWLSAFSNILD